MATTVAAKMVQANRTRFGKLERGEEYLRGEDEGDSGLLLLILSLGEVWRGWLWLRGTRMGWDGQISVLFSSIGPESGALPRRELGVSYDDRVASFSQQRPEVIGERID